ncbi:MAG: CPBP family intramembrane metalloprotease [Butyrivibrio sp.]|nr:CPBP family intramembrane metalloprotease [Muribaculum sp.]MCM1552968.1 CPBP family intramembrane metalloprotease [Butyrivibrio sp.]
MFIGMDKTTKRILIFLGTTFAVTYLYEFLVLYPLVLSDETAMQTLGQALLGVVMIFPALGVLVTRLITKEGFKGSSFLLPKTGKRSIKWFVFAWFAPVVFTVVGAGVYFLIYPQRLDLGLSYAGELMAASGVEMSTEMLRNTMIAQGVMAVLLGPALNIFTCFGEEWGWRGYLLPKMREKLPLFAVLLVNGVIWGLWHAPITALGHNYGTGYPGYPVTGILAMCFFCIVLGVIFSFITIKTGSCIPAALAHGSLNGFASMPIYFTNGKDINPFVGPAPTGIIGGCAFILCAAVMAWSLLRGQQKASLGIRSSEQQAVSAAGVAAADALNGDAAVDEKKMEP